MVPKRAFTANRAVIDDALPSIQAIAAHNATCVTTGGTAIGAIPYSINKSKYAKRGPDKKDRAQRRCGRCKLYKGEYALVCYSKGWRGSKNCQFFNDDGTAK